MPAKQFCCCIQAAQESFCGRRGQGAEIALTLSGVNDCSATSTAGNDAGTDDAAPFQRPQIVYNDTEPIFGKVKVTLRKLGSKLDHLGIKAELIGDIELRGEKTRHTFLHVEKVLSASGELYRNTTYDFSFDSQSSDGANCNRRHESYCGTKVRLRYFVRVTLERRAGDVSTEQEIAVHVPSSLPEVTRNVKTEVGVGDTLHLEMECNKWKYHLGDTIIGSINFLLVGTEITSVTLQIARREVTSAQQQQQQQGQSPSSSGAEQEIVASHEVLDGCPQTGDVVPIRIYLANYPLTPTMRSVEERFSVKYYLNLVIMDADGNQYFKQQEIKLYRRNMTDVKPTAAAAVDTPTRTSRAKKKKPIQLKFSRAAMITLPN